MSSRKMEFWDVLFLEKCEKNEKALSRINSDSHGKLGVRVRHAKVTGCRKTSAVL